MNNRIFTSLPLISLLACLSWWPANRAVAQDIQHDIRQLVAQSQQLPLHEDIDAYTASLDTIAAILAYYATAPDTTAARRLLSGPTLLQYYASNAPILAYLKQSKLDSLFWDYVPNEQMTFGWLDSPQRNNFLKKTNKAVLFSKNGLIDVAKIERAYADPTPPQPMALRKAAEEAKLGDLAPPSANYISMALSGLSDWIGKRAQEELTYTFLTRLRSQLNENGLNYLFPHTVEYLPTLNLINYKAILPSIRIAFAKDLNQVALNLGEFLHFKDKDNYNDPAVYNLFLIYRLLDLSFREVPLSDILAFTYTQLSDARLNTRRAIDLKLAEAAKTTPEYGTIATSFGRFADQLADLELAMQLAKGELSDYEDELVDAYGEEAVRPLRDRVNALLNFNFANLLFSTDEAPALIKAWLMGTEDYDYYLAHPNLSKYDELFSSDRDTLSDTHFRAAGLTSVRELLLRRERPRELYGHFIELRHSLDSLAAILNVPDAPSDEWAIKDLLADRLAQETAYFTAANADEKVRIRLDYLNRMLQEVVLGNTLASSPAIAQLDAIAQRLDELTRQQADSASPNYQRLFPPDQVSERYPSLLQKVEAVEAEFVQLQNALEKYSWEKAENLIRAHRNAANFETVFGLGKELFFLLAKTSPNTDPTSSGHFTSTADLSGFMLDPLTSELLKGLAVERVKRVPGLASVQADAISRLVMDFTQQLQLIKQPLEGSNEQEKRIQKRIRIVSFITTTISTLVESPILPNLIRPQQPLSLSQQLPGFSKVPAVNQELNELFRFSQEGEFRYAITNLLNLVDLFGIVPSGSKRQTKLMEQHEQLKQQLADIQSQQLGASYQGLAFRKQETTAPADIQLLQTELHDLENRLSRLDTARINRERQRLFLYGTFMADVAAANTPDAFAAALNNVALPPGSSQLKRNKPFGLELNAYFGFSLAEEVLDLPTNTAANVGLPAAAAKTLALYVPVGLSMSWKGRYTQRSSYSLFFPLVDLGAVSAYRFDTANNRVQRLPQFTFQNVFSPGAHLKYNFANAPFSLGIGAQYGPGLRRIKPDGAPALDVAAIRYMLTFAVDVPIFSLSNRP